MKPAEISQKIGFWAIAATLFLAPHFFLPITSDFYDFNKMILLFIAAGIVLISLSVTFIFDRQVRLNRNPLVVPLLLLGGSWLLSSFLRSPNYMDAFFEPGQTGTIVALILFFFGAVNLVRSKKEVETLAYVFVASMSLLSLVSILWSSGLLSSVAPLAFMKSSVWTPTGNPLSTIVLLVSLLPFLAIMIIKDKSGSLRTLLFSLSLFFSVIASGLVAFQLFKSNSPFKPVFLPQAASWSIALETLKVSPLLGTGPSTFLADFTQFRPLALNMTSSWAYRFSSSNNYFLQVLATCGLVGLAVYALVIAKSFSLFSKAFRSSSESPLMPFALASSAAALVLFASQLIVAPNFSTLFAIFALLSMSVVSLKLAGSSQVYDANIDIIAASDTGMRTPILPWVALLLSLALFVPVAFVSGKYYLAETYYQDAIVAAGANQGKQTYDSLIQAMTLNPYRDTYRIVYSQTNMLLANSIAAQKDLTEDDKKNITSLIQQAIREGKNAVTLNPRKVTNVENLASIYRTLINLAQDADSWTIAAYQEAIKLDPANPNLRIALGGVLFAQKNYAQAASLFQTAATLKSDMPNAYYNLSAALREGGDIQNAYLAMQTVVSLLDKNSADYAKAQEELAELGKKLPAATTPTPTPTAAAATKSQLEAPKPMPTAKITPIKLPADMAPNATPAPTGTATPAIVSPTPTP